MRKAIYVAGLVLLGGALIIQSVWGADAKPAQLLNASYDVVRAGEGGGCRCSWFGRATPSSLGGWDQVVKTHFAEGGVLDQVMAARR